MKEEICQRKHGGTACSTNHIAQGQMVPNWDELVSEEDYNDGDLLFDFFTQKGAVNDRVKFDSSKEEITCDVTNQSNSCLQLESTF